MQPAYAGRSALWAAVLAADGITGPHRALEGEAGFFKLYVGCEPPSLEELAEPRDFWQIERVSIKPYPSCGGNHRATQAAIMLATEADLNPADIERVEVWVPYIDVWFVGAPFEIGKDPQVDAQFSVTYSTALGLVHRKAGLEQYKAENVVADEAVLDVVRRIKVCEIPNSKGLRTDEIAHEVKVWTHDGRELSRRVKLVHGQWQDPFTLDETADKLRECAQFAGLWSTDRIEDVIAALKDLEQIPSTGSFVEAQLVIPGADQTFQQLRRLANDEQTDSLAAVARPAYSGDHLWHRLQQP
jgi:2-methylcitrate dehydratase PrpD